MPYISNIVAKTLNKIEKDKIKSGLAAILEDVIGKPERVLMLTIEDGVTFYFAGKECSGAYIEVKLLGNLTKEHKHVITNEIGNLYSEIVGLDKKSIYITFHEIERENWGYNGKTFAH